MAPSTTRGNPVPLIIFIVLFVFSTVGLVLVAMELADARKLMDTGFNPNAPASKRVIDDLEAKGEGLKQALLKAKEEVLEREIVVEQYKEFTGLPDAAKLDGKKKELRDRIEKILHGRGKPTVAPAATFVGLLEVLEKEKLLLDEQIRDMKLAHEQEIKGLRTRLKAEEAAVTEKQTAVDERDEQIEKLKNKLSEDAMNAKQEATTLRAALEKTRAQMDEMRTELMERIAMLEADNANLRRQIVDLRREKGPLKGKTIDFTTAGEPADGKVILVDREAGVIVDIGRKKGVRRGLEFEVYLQKGDGTRVKRGKIQIKTVFPEISRAILVDGGDPTQLIYKNDIIINPAFDPGRAKVFVADTTFDAVKKQAFRDALSEYGSVLEEDLTLRTDYLIIGTQKGKFVEKAQKLSIVMIREGELNAFLGR